MKVIPQNIAKLMSPEDRKAFGKGAMTAEEALAKAEVKNEKELQKQIVALLRLKGIEPIVSRMDKRTSNNLGTPDILFAVAPLSVIGTYLELGNRACAWEVKFGDGKLSIEQQQMHVRMSTYPNGWKIKTVRSVDEVLAELKEMGIE